jgi:CheY-like chemotaxis protein
MAEIDDARPVFGELLKQSQSALAGLQALEEQLSTRLADQHAQLKQVRSELDEAHAALTTLRGNHDRLIAEHARTVDDAAHQREARAGLEAQIAGVRGELADALRERGELVAARNKERRELEDRLARQEASLAEGVSRLGALEAQLDEFAASQARWATEREALVGARDQLGGRLADLEAEKRKVEDELAHAIHNREQLRTVFEDLKRTHAAAAERSAAAFKEMSHLQDELAAAAEQAAAQGQEITRLKDELAQATSLADEWQADQLKWATDRESLLSASQAAEARRIALESDLARAQLALTERTVLAEVEAAQLRQQAAALEMRLADDRGQLEASVVAAQDQLRQVAESVAAAEKARADAQLQYANLVDRAQVTAQEWSARRQALAEENQRLTQEATEARQALRGADERHRELEARLHQVEEAQREETAALEDALRAARDAGTRPLTPEQSHRINTRLNAIVGFSSILLDPKTNAIPPSDQAEYLQLIDANSRGLAEELRLLSVAGGTPMVVSTPAEKVPAVASLGGNAVPPVVLVGDPDPAVRERLSPFLTRAGYEVHFVDTTEDTIKQAGILEPLLIMVEATLQPGGAPAVIAALKRDPRTADIPVVVTTKNLADPLGVDLGQVDVLSKPIDRQQLLQVMINHDLRADAKRARKLPATVLVIDDDPLSLRLLRAVLKPLQIDVITADGGKAGIEIARQGKPELIICDLMMPEVDGFDVIAALRSDPQTSKIPILVYTGKSITAEDQQRLQGLIPSIIRKGEFSRERFLEFLLKRGERRARGTTPPIAA